MKPVRIEPYGDANASFRQDSGLGRLKGRVALVCIALLSLAAVGAALFSQHRLDMLPCPWCILQRMIFLLIAALALINLPLRGLAAQGGVVLLALAALGGGAAALWQHFVASSSVSCNQTWADRLIGSTGLDSRWPEVFGVFASCADAKVKMLGVPYEFYSLALFVVILWLTWRVTRGA